MTRIAALRPTKARTVRAYALAHEKGLAPIDSPHRQTEHEHRRRRYVNHWHRARAVAGVEQVLSCFQVSRYQDSGKHPFAVLGT